ncbi:MAG: RNase adapter RapZ [Thermaerobacter sp.]|nr:RNase adapter RapZ [Thermaerobacter sp.]
MQFVVVTGLSGAGKSQAMHVLEDMGFFCVDNLPSDLVAKFVEILDAQQRIERVAVAIDVRGGAFFERAASALTELEEHGVPYRILFLEAREEVLLRRYKETRRRHPLATEGRVLEAIRLERQQLEEVRGRAHFTLDTSDLTPAQLRAELGRLFSQSGSQDQLLVQVVSFGFKHGLPLDADLVFDVRFLPNPNYIPKLQHKTGQDPDVQEYVLRWPIARQLLMHLGSLIDFLLPQYAAEGKTQLVVAIGCTGGQHRSVVIAEELARRLQDPSRRIGIEHRDCNRAGGGSA